MNADTRTSSSPFFSERPTAMEKRATLAFVNLRIATLPDRHNKFSNLLHVIFPAKPHHFSAAKVVCGAHFVYGLQGLLRIGQ